VSLPYSEGDWVAIPLRDDSGYGVGRIARMAPGGRVLLGYFFARKTSEPPTLRDVSDLESTMAFMVRRFGDQRLIAGQWPILPGSDNWRRQDWPMPMFSRREPIGGRAWRVEYREDNPNSNPRETLIAQEEVNHYPEDALLGAGVVEILLTRALSRNGVN
jgi:hypothetical protein